MMIFNSYAILNKKGAIITVSTLALLSLSISIYNYTIKTCPFFNKNLKSNVNNTPIITTSNIELIEPENKKETEISEITNELETQN
jgi:hypothetical protein